MKGHVTKIAILICIGYIKVHETVFYFLESINMGVFVDEFYL